MTLKQKIPVPEATDSELLQMEQAVLRSAREIQASPVVAPRRWRLPAFGLAACALLLLFAGKFLFPQDTATNATSVDIANTTVPSPAAYATSAHEELTVDLGDAKIRLSANTVLDVQDLIDGGRRVILHGGEVSCSVAPRHDRAPFEVLAGQVVVKVVGTEFSVARGSEVRVTVVHGIVSVAGQHEAIELRAGSVWTGSDNPAKGTMASGLRTLAMDTKNGDEASLASKGKSDHKVASAERNGTAKASRERPDREPPLVPLDKVLAGANPIKPVVLPSYGDEVAKLLRVSSDSPKTAVRDLQSLAAKATGPSASFALYSRAYLLFFSLHEYADVQQAAENYARRFPRGAEAEDMLWLRVRASCERDDHSSCRRAAHTYLRKFPRGVFRKLAQRITATSDSD